MGSVPLYGPERGIGFFYPINRSLLTLPHTPAHTGQSVWTVFHFTDLKEESSGRSASYVCLVCMLCRYALYLCLVCILHMYACLVCLPYMYALYVCLICILHMYALYVYGSERGEQRQVCLFCMPCMYALYVCLICMSLYWK